MGQTLCRGAELNCRRKDFQSFALPLSYPGYFVKTTKANSETYPIILELPKKAILEHSFLLFVNKIHCGQ